MSSLAYPSEASRRRMPGRTLAAAAASRGPDLLLASVVAVFAAVLLLQVTGDFNVDSWLALVTGRELWHTGIPHREVLTAMSYGHPWIDQQWLSQLASYGLYRLGGLGTLCVVEVALLVLPIGAATAAARRFGAPFRSVLLVLPLCVAMIAPSREIRTQAFAIPLFMATAYLLARDGRMPSRRVFWSLPILALWANLHGTVSLGAMLVTLYAATLLWERRRQLRRSLRPWRKPLTLALGAAAAPLITPYGLHIVGYYHETMVSSTLRQYVSEWQPVTSDLMSTIVLLALAGLAIWSFGRNPDRTTQWEKLALLVLAASSVEVIRNTLFLGLLGLMVVPVSLGSGPRDPRPAGERANAKRDAAVHRGDRRRAWINGSCALAATLIVAIAAVAVIVRPDSVIEDSAQSPRLLGAVERATAADPSLRVLADDHFSDWLLWQDARLAGRIANDARFELLTSAQLGALRAVFAVIGPDWKQGAQGYRLLVLSRGADPGTVKEFLAEPGRRILYEDAKRIVILRSSSATATSFTAVASRG